MTESGVTFDQLSAGQWGLLTTAQAEAAGLSRMHLSRLTKTGHIERVGHGVYATLAAAQDLFTPQRAAWLALDPRPMAYERLVEPHLAGVLSHASAAELHEVGTIRPDGIEFIFPVRKQSRRRGLRLHRGRLDADDVTLVDGLPTTTAARTVVDLLGDGHDIDHVGQVVGDAVHRDMVTLESLSSALEPIAARYGHQSGEAFVESLLATTGQDSLTLMEQVAPLFQPPAAIQQALAAFQSVHHPIFDQGIPPGMASMLQTAAAWSKIAGSYPTVESLAPELRIFRAALPLISSTQHAALANVVGRYSQILGSLGVQSAKMNHDDRSDPDLAEPVRPGQEPGQDP